MLLFFFLLLFIYLYIFVSLTIWVLWIFPIFFCCLCLVGSLKLRIITWIPSGAWNSTMGIGQKCSLFLSHIFFLGLWCFCSLHSKENSLMKFWNSILWIWNLKYVVRLSVRLCLSVFFFFVKQLPFVFIYLSMNWVSFFSFQVLFFLNL